MQKKVGQYLLVQELGKGQFGSVYKGLDTSDGNKEYAVKLLPRVKVESSPLISKLFRSEISIMRIVDHPNILKLHDYLETGTNYYVVVQYCKDGDMEKYLQQVGKVEEEEAVFFLKQIMSGFVYLHSHKIMHRDFKLANIFLHDKQLIIGDFGFAKAGTDMTSTKLGTPYNMSPEIIFSTGKTMYTSKTDLWSIGVVYFQLLFGVLPFQVMTLEELKFEVRYSSGKNLKFPPSTLISEESQELLRGLLEYDPSARISWKQFFNHRLFDKFTEYPPAKNIMVNNNTSNNMDNSMHHMIPNSNILNTDSKMNEKEKIAERRVSTLEDAVEQNFESEKKEVNRNMMYSSAFDIPNPIPLKQGHSGGHQDYQHNLENQSVLTFAKQSKLNSIDECNNYFTHERNKHLFVLQIAKKAKDLIKIEDFKDKTGHFLLLSYCLARKGVMMIDFVVKSLRYKSEVFEVEGFYDFCSSQVCDRLVQSMEEEHKGSIVFITHIEQRTKDKNIQNLDESLLYSVKDNSCTEAYIDTVIDKVLVHLCVWMKNEPSTHVSLRSLKNLCVYLHFTLNLSLSFPLYPHSESSSVFNWKSFFDTVDKYTDDQYMTIVSKYHNRKDELDDNGCFIFSVKNVLC